MDWLQDTMVSKEDFIMHLFQGLPFEYDALVANVNWQDLLRNRSKILRRGSIQEQFQRIPIWSS